MTREEAEALAAKREQHKSPGLALKQWRAVHNNVKGWHVALVDDDQQIGVRAMLNARAAYQRGDMVAFLDAAFEGTMANIRVDLGDPA